MNLWLSLCFSMTINVLRNCVWVVLSDISEFFYIAIDVHVANNDRLVVCVPVGDECWFVSCPLFSCLVCFVRYYMIIFLFRYLLFYCRWLSLFLVSSWHSSKVVQAVWMWLEWETIGVMHGLLLMIALHLSSPVWLMHLYHSILWCQIVILYDSWSCSKWYVLY